MLGVLPGGRGNDFARVLGIPLDPVAACEVIAGGHVKELDLGQVGEKIFIGIASCGFDSVANRIANETRVVRGNLVYAYGALRALAGWKPATFEVTLDGGPPREVTGYTVAAANSGAYGGGMYLAPDASLEDGMLDVVMVEHVPKLRFLRLLPTVFKGEHVKQRMWSSSAAREVSISADRPFTMYADGDPIDELPVTVRALPRAVRVIVPTMSALGAKIVAARAVGELARRAGRGGGTSLPGKVLIRLEPHAIAELSARLRRGCAVISATNGKTTTAAMAASILSAQVSRSCTIAPAPTWPAEWPRRCSPRRVAGGQIDGELGLFEVDEFWLDQRHARARAPSDAARQPVPGSARPLRRTRDDRRSVGAPCRRSLPGGTRLALNADDPLIADLGRGIDGVTYFGVEDPSVAMPEMQHASDSKHCRRCGAAYVYDAIYLGHLGRYRCPSCGAGAAGSGGGCRGDRARRDARRHDSGCERRTARQTSICPSPACTTSTTRSARPRCASTSASPLEQIVAGLEAVTAAFGRAETVRIGDAELSILLIKNPAGANEILRTLALEGASSTCSAILNDRTADGRDVSWVWDADFEVLAPRVRHAHLRGHARRGAGVRMKYAGVPSGRLSWSRTCSARARRSDRATHLGQALFVLPTYTALLELRDVLAARGHVAQFWEGPR